MNPPWRAEELRLLPAISATVRRPLPGPALGMQASVDVTARFASELELGPAPGFVLLREAHGADAEFAAVQIRPGDPAVPDRTIGLSSTLWTRLDVRLGDTVHVCRYDMPEADEVTVGYDPAAFGSDPPQEILLGLRATATVVTAKRTVWIPAAVTGVRRRLEVLEAEPSPAVMTDATRIISVASPGAAAPLDDLATDVQRTVRVRRTDIGGLDDVYTALERTLTRALLRGDVLSGLGIRPTKGVLFHGPPGSGKTLLARAVGGELQANTIVVAANDIIGGFPGDTEKNLRRIFEHALTNAPSLVLIDEIDVLVGDRRAMGSTSDVRISTQLLALLDGLHPTDGVCVIGTTNRLDAIDPAYRRPGRFDAELYIGPPRTAEARREVLEVHTRSMPMTPAAVRRLAVAARDELAGATGADLMSFARAIGLHALDRWDSATVSPDTDDVAVESIDVAAACAGFFPSLLPSIRTAPVGDLSWEDIVGLEDVKCELLTLAGQVLAAESAVRQGALVWGPPGTGKSALVGALAEELRAAMVEVDASAIFNQWLGESESQLRIAFERARAVQPSVLVLDHVEILASRESDGTGAGADRRVLGTLLSEVDRTLQAGGVVIVGITDRPAMIDAALLRSGRLGVSLEVPHPDPGRVVEVAQQLARSVIGSGEADIAHPPDVGLLRDAIMARAGEEPTVADVVLAAARCGDLRTRDVAVEEPSSATGLNEDSK